jgi:hypothetical protein
MADDLGNLIEFVLKNPLIVIGVILIIVVLMRMRKQPAAPSAPVRRAPMIPKVQRREDFGIFDNVIKAAQNAGNAVASTVKGAVQGVAPCPKGTCRGGLFGKCAAKNCRWCAVGSKLNPQCIKDNKMKACKGCFVRGGKCDKQACAAACCKKIVKK